MFKHNIVHYAVKSLRVFFSSSSVIAYQNIRMNRQPLHCLYQHIYIAQCFNLWVTNITAYFIYMESKDVGKRNKHNMNGYTWEGTHTKHDPSYYVWFQKNPKCLMHSFMLVHKVYYYSQK